MIMSDSLRDGINALLTTSEVAELLRVNRSTLSRWRAAGNLYLHYLGTSADHAGLARLNDRGRTGSERRADLGE
jgi:excisionase family DNA binding protein